jgi:hypothetical protein
MMIWTHLGTRTGIWVIDTLSRLWAKIIHAIAIATASYYQAGKNDNSAY